MIKMNSFNLAKRISFAGLLLLILFISLSSIHAGDVNETILNSNDDSTFFIKDDALLKIDGESVINDGAEEQKNRTELTSPTSKTYYGGNYEVTLIDSNTGESLANKTVTFSINNVEYSVNTSSNGVASVNLKLNPGSYLATAYFAGDDNFNASNNLSGQVKLLNTITAKDVTKYYKGSKNYQATYLDSNGKALKNKNVAITVNGKKYTRKTDANGVASLAINLKPGTYKVTATNPVTGEQLTTTFKILTTVSASDLKKVRGDSKSFVVKFLKSNGKALVKKQVKVKINSKVYYYKTNQYGKIKLSFNAFKKGTYAVTSYNNDGLSQTNTVKIYNIATTKLSVNVPDDYIILPNGSKNVKIKFSTSLGGDSNVGKSIRIKINEKTYYRSTDSKGVVNFNLPVTEGIFAVDYWYVGDKFFKPVKMTTSVTVLKTNDTQLSVKGLKSFGYGAGSLFKVIFKAGNVPLAKKTVSFNVANQTYLATTDNGGIASIPINLDIGNYTVNYTAPADSMVKAASGSCDIDVFKRSNPKLTWKCGGVYNNVLQSFGVLLVNSDGTPVSGGKIIWTVGSKTYNVKTASDGYAAIKTKVPSGKYEISVSFIGSNDYLPVSISKNINVKSSKYGGGLNVKDEGYYSNEYLQPSSHCQVNAPKIKSLVKSLTSGLTSDMDKAKAIFNYVRDNVRYSYYYDTKHGATGTLNAKRGNCVDQSHLLISMYRTAGLKARYVHGTCFFGQHWYGHVWTQVLIGTTWFAGDPISYGNSLGKIKNWNTHTYGLHSRYVSLPF